MSKRATTFWTIIGVLLYFAAMTVQGEPQDLSVPPEWGVYRGTSDGSLVFEDARGTIRLVDAEGGLQHTIERK